MTGDPIEAAVARPATSFGRAVPRTACAPPRATTGTRDVGRARPRCLLGTCSDGFEEAVPALEASLTALTRAQSTPGYVPPNVDPLRQRTTVNAGSIDGNLSTATYGTSSGTRPSLRRFGAADLLERHRDALSTMSRRPS
jgi:hypothetical protein